MWGLQENENNMLDIILNSTFGSVIVVVLLKMIFAPRTEVLEEDGNQIKDKER